MTANTLDLAQEPPNFTLVLGGPLFQLLRRTRLSDDALDLLHRRIVVISLFAWLPLFLLAAAGGHLLGGDLPVPFLLDVEVHARFLLALPLLIVAELVVHKRMRPVLKQFTARHLIPDHARKRFDAAVESVIRLRNSVLAEILLIAFVYGVFALVIWPNFVALRTTTWYAVVTEAGATSTPAGIWYKYLSLPLFQFLLLRWYYRIAIWARFLWQVSRIELSLVPSHPDRLGGLGFLSATASAFVPLASAHGALLAGLIASRIFHLGAGLPDFKVEIALVVVLVQCLVFLPLLPFAVQLAAAKRTGLREYGTLAERYVREFDAKWLRGGAPDDEPFVGSGDIQSLADMGGSFEIVQEMKSAPVTKSAVLQLGVATLAPLTPLLLTIMPFEELVKKLFGVVF